MLTQTKENIPPQTSCLPQRHLVSFILVSAKKGWAWLSISCFMGLIMACQAGIWSPPLPFPPSPDTRPPVTTTKPISSSPQLISPPSSTLTTLRQSLATLTTTHTPCQDDMVSFQATALSAQPRHKPNETYPVSWSPQEDLIAYVAEDSLWLAAGPAYRPQRLVHLADSRLSQALWSPDGQHLAVTGVLLSEQDFIGYVVWVFQKDGQVVVDGDISGYHPKLITLHLR